MNPHRPGKPRPAKKIPIANAGIDGHLGEQPAELVEVAMVDAVVNHADQEEHAGRADAVGDHLEHRAVDAHRPVVGIVIVAGRGAPHADAQQT